MGHSKSHPAVVFLHGLAGYGGEWGDVSSRLSCRTLTPDLPGHGSSFDPDAPGSSRLDVAELLDSVAAAITRFSRGLPVVLVGQSMGGLVAMRVARDNPGLVAHLVLVESGIGAMTPDDRARLQKWFDRWPDVFDDADEATQFFGADRPSTPAWVAGLLPTPQGLHRRFDPAAMVKLMEDLAGPGSADVWRHLSAFGIPSTLILAERSIIADGEVDAMLEAHPATTLLRVADAGHDVHLDQPDAVARAVTNIVLN